MKVKISIIFLVLTTSIFGQEIQFVKADNGLIIREKPSQQSERIGKVLYGVKVKVIKETGIKLEIIDGQKSIAGQWVEIQEVDGWHKGFVFDGYLTVNELFLLPEPNIRQLRKQVASAQNKEVIYHYLINHYLPTSEKKDLEFLEYNDWKSASPCAFKQEFKSGIKYSVFECKEAGGISVELELPRMNRKLLMNWIEKIDEVDKINEANTPPNVWKESNSKFEPEDAVPGCYYRIEERKNTTLVNLYCGC